MSAQTHEDHGTSTGKYLVGFVLAVILTLMAFVPIMLHWLDDWSVSAKVIYLLGLALIQMAVQIVFFLHLNEGPDAKWNVGSMWFAVGCVFIIIFGTWWTMQHLNYNMMGGSGRVDIYQAPPAPEASSSSQSSTTTTITTTTVEVGGEADE